MGPPIAAARRQAYIARMTATAKPVPLPEATKPPAPPETNAPPAPGAAAPQEIGGRKGPEPTRYGDWEKDGRCVDF